LGFPLSGCAAGFGLRVRLPVFNPKNVIESVPPSFTDGFFCSLPIHRRFSKTPDKSGNYTIL
jgi:hypothetical protein